MLIQHFPGDKKKTQNHSRNGWKADEDSHPEPPAYMLEQRPPSCPTIPQTPHQVHTSFSVPHIQIQISLPSVSNTYQICYPCERRRLTSHPHETTETYNYF